MVSLRQRKKINKLAGAAIDARERIRRVYPLVAVRRIDRDCMPDMQIYKD